MKHSIMLASTLGALVHLSTSQAVSWCREEGCEGCPSSIITSGPGYPQCVIYNSTTVFGGQGFKPGTEKIKYLVWGQFEDPCDGAPGSYMVRSPADLAAEGCGDLVYHTEEAECSTQLEMQETFMVQFCCGYDHCNEAGVPWDQKDGGGSGWKGAFIKTANGTIIEPIAIGLPPSINHTSRATNCANFKEGSYKPVKEPYLKTFNTQTISGSVPASEEDRTIKISYDQSVSRTTSFSASLGDPFGVISVTVGIEFTNEETHGFEVELPVKAGESGRVGWTPVFLCTKGSLETCHGIRTTNEETCTPYVQNGKVHGDYRIIQT